MGKITITVGEITANAVTMESFTGMTSDRMLRLTRLLCSNDPRRIKRGLRLAREEVLHG